MWEPATGEIVAWTSQNAGTLLLPSAGTTFDDTIVVPCSDFARVATLAHASCAEAAPGAIDATAAQHRTSARTLTSTDPWPDDASRPEATRRARCGSRSDP